MAGWTPPPFGSFGPAPNTAPAGGFGGFQNPYNSMYRSPWQEAMYPRLTDEQRAANQANFMGRDLSGADFDRGIPDSQQFGVPDSTRGSDALLALSSGGEGGGLGMLSQIIPLGLAMTSPIGMAMALGSHVSGQFGPGANLAFNMLTGNPRGAAEGFLSNDLNWRDAITSFQENGMSGVRDWFLGRDTQPQQENLGTYGDWGSSRQDQGYGPLMGSPNLGQNVQVHSENIDPTSSMLEDYVNILRGNPITSPSGTPILGQAFNDQQTQGMDNLLRFAGYDPIAMAIRQDPWDGMRADLVPMGGRHFGQEWGAGFDPWANPQLGGGTDKFASAGGSVRPSGFYSF